VRPFTVTYKGESLVVDLPGYYPNGDGDGVVVGDDMRVVDEALRAEGETRWRAFASSSSRSGSALAAIDA
jgi:hypothetical protein